MGRKTQTYIGLKNKEEKKNKKDEANTVHGPYDHVCVVCEFVLGGVNKSFSTNGSHIDMTGGRNIFFALKSTSTFIFQIFGIILTLCGDLG